MVAGEIVVTEESLMTDPNAPTTPGRRRHGDPLHLVDPAPARATGRPPGPPGYRRPRIRPTGELPDGRGSGGPADDAERTPGPAPAPDSVPAPGPPAGPPAQPAWQPPAAPAGDLPAAAQRPELGLVVVGLIFGLVGAGVVANQVAGFQVSSLSELGPSVLVIAGLACALLGIVGILTRRRRG